MKLSTWTQWLLGIAALQLPFACSSDKPGGNPEAVSGSANTGGASGSRSVTGGANGAGGSRASGGMGMAAPQCKKLAEVDEPDGEFIDANCDGIDGDKLKAIFVSPAGADTASGALNGPVKSWKRGIELALAQKKDLYICDGTYQENIGLEGRLSLHVYGGYDCTTWNRRNQRPLLSPQVGLPIRIKNVQGSVLFDRIAVSAPNAIETGGSSIGVYVSNSDDVTITQSEIIAGSGVKGADGLPIAAIATPPKAGAVGTAPTSLTCGGASGNGGFDSAILCAINGGTSSVRGGQGQDGPGSCCSSGGAYCVCAGLTLTGVETLGTPPAPGASPLRGSEGQDGLGPDGGFGAINSDTGYVPSRGAQGGYGLPGQSGSGGKGAPGGPSIGACAYAPGPGGGQGGFGGCGGRGGEGGQSGGASIAVLAYESHLTLSQSSLRTSSGGDGGAAGPGGGAQLGGDGGPAGGIGAGSGKPGATGGRGGQGGPGAGGPSIGIVAVGVAPKLQGVLYDVRRGGLGARGTRVVPDADAGVAADYWPVNIRPEVNGSAGAAGQGGI